MATIREIQAKISATTSGMRSSVKGVIDDLKDMRKEAENTSKAMSGNFDRQGRSAEKFKSQIYSLEKRQESQIKSVEKARVEYDKMAKTYGENSSQARQAEQNLHTQIATQKDLSSQVGLTREQFRSFASEQQAQESLSGRLGQSFTNFGNTLGGVSEKAREVGGNLTKWITVPALGAATAATAIVASFGWKRLVGIDNARAQLKGMGYDAEDVGRITEQVSEAVTGGMMTVAEGTSVAAGAMAAGVEEGEELSKYIKLVDAASVGMNRSVSETAMIFNRVQGSGKLMTNELNMVEESMPGFSNKMAEHLEVPPEKMREMVTAGEVTSDDFLTVMDGMAGGMAEAFADTWQGMVANTKANIGIIGENLLGGVFEQSKESIAEFLDLLRSEDLRQWAKDTGLILEEWFTRIVTWTKSAIDWFMELETGTKKLLGGFAGFAVALGPALVALGTLGGVLAGVSKGIGSFFTFLAPLGKAFGLLSVTLADGTKKVGLIAKAISWLGRAFTLLTGPVGWTIAAIIAVGAAFITAYKKSETFRTFVDGIVDKFKDALEWIGKFKDGIIGLFQDDGVKGIDILTSLGLSDELVQSLWDFTGHFVEFYHNVKEQIENIKIAFQGVLDFFKGDNESGIKLLQSIGLSDDQIEDIFIAVHKIKKAFTEFKTDVSTAFKAVSDFFKEQFSGMFDWWNENGGPFLDALGKAFTWVKDLISGELEETEGNWSSFVDLLTGLWDGAWAIISSVVEAAWEQIKLIIELGTAVAQGVMELFTHAVNGDWDKFWETLKETAGRIKDIIVEYITNMKDIVVDLFFDIFGGAIDWFTQTQDGLKEKAREIDEAIVQKFTEMKDAVIGKFVEIKDGVVGKFTEIKDSVATTVTEFKDNVVGKFTEVKDSITGSITDAKDGVTGKFTEIKDGVTTTATETKDAVVGKFTEIRDGIVGRVSETFEPVITTFVSIRDGVNSRMAALRDILVFIFNKIKDKIISAIREARDNVVERFQGLYNRVSEIVVGLYNRLHERFTAIRDSVVNIVLGLYNRVRERFLNIYNSVSNIVTNLRERVVSIYTNLRDRVVGVVTNLRDRAVAIFTSVRDNIVSRVTNLRDRASAIFGNLRDRVTTTVTNLRDRASNTFTSLRDRIASTVGSARDRATSLFNNMRDRVVNTVRNLWDRVSSFFSNIYNTIRDKMRNAKDKAVGFATDLYDGAKKQFENLSSAASDMMDKIGQWIDEKKQAVVDKATSLGTGIANAAIGGFNKMISGINNVADLLGYDGNLIQEIPTYSKGTNKHPGGAAIVGDKGPGNSTGGGGGSNTRELIEMPNGKKFIADGNLLIPNAPKGMKVKSNKETEEWLSKNSGGSNSNAFTRTVSKVSDFAKDTTSKAITGAKNVYGKVVDTAEQVWEYAKDPGALVTDIINKVDFNMAGKPLEFAKLGLGKVKSVVTDYIKGLFDKADGAGDGSHILGKQIYQYFGKYGIGGSLGLGFNGGKHYGIDTAHKHEPLLSPINGVVSKIWQDYGGGNSLQVSAGKYTWWFMHLTRALKAVGDRVKAGEKIAITGNTGKFLSGTGHLHTQVMQGGIGNAFAIDPIPVLKNLQGAGSAVTGAASKIKGYFKGGITSGIPELAWLNEEGFRESIISHNPAHRERSESIWESTGNKLGFDNSNTIEQTLIQILSETAKGNKLEAESINVLRGILDKDNTQSSSELYRRFKDYEKSKNKTNRTTKGRV